MKYKREIFKRNKKFLRNSISKKSLPSHVMSGLTSFFESDACRMNFKGIPYLWGSPMTKFWGHPQNFCPSLVSCSSFHCNRTDRGNFEIFPKFCPSRKFEMSFVWFAEEEASSGEFLSSSQKFCPYSTVKGNRNLTIDMTEPLWRLRIPLRQESGQT